MRLHACHIFHSYEKMFVSQKYGSDLVKTYQLDSSKHTSIHQLSGGRVGARNSSILSRLRILFVVRQLTVFSSSRLVTGRIINHQGIALQFKVEGSLVGIIE